MASVTLATGPVAVRELSVAEIRDWLKDLASTDPAQEIDLADWLLYQDEGLRLADFQRLTDLDAAALEALRPSELEALLARCKEVNPRFFTALARVRAMGEMAIRQRNSTPSNAPAPRSPGWFARMFGRGPGAA